MLRTHRIIHLLLLASCVVSPCQAKPEKSDALSNFKKLDFPMPFCKSSLNLEIGSNYFVEIENQLPGTARYNQLIKLYNRKNWADLEGALLAFRSEFESSPLVEAIDFLELESQVEQISIEDEVNLKKIENRFRDLLVLYPRSTLAPILSGTLAQLYLKRGNYPKALSLYKSSRELFPFHSSNCVFLLGEAEANYGIGNTVEATKGFKSVAQKCQSSRLELGAKLRLIDIERDEAANQKEIISKYEKLINQNPTVVPRLYPEALLNLGELKYRSKNFPSAVFYLQDYHRNSSDSHLCRPLYLKRVADLSLQQGKTFGEIVGNYLSVFEKYPKTEVGRLSKALAYLIELPFVSDQESERRLEAINAEINSLQNAEFKSQLEINRGLALLDRGEDEGLEALSKLKSRYDGLFKTDLDPYIRKKLLSIYKGREEKNVGLSDRARDQFLLEPIEDSYQAWFQGTLDDRKAQNLYERLIQIRFSESLDANAPKKAIQKLERWKKTPLFRPEAISTQMKTFFSAGLAGWWIKQREPNPQGIASELVDKTQELEIFFKPVGEALWHQASMDLQKPGSRSISSLPLTKRLPPPLGLLLGRAYRATKQYEYSKAALEKVSGKEWFPYQTIELIKTLNSGGESRKAMVYGEKAFLKIPKEFQKEVLNLLRDTVLSGKQWKSSSSVLKLATSLQLSEKELAPFYVMDGKASFERADYQISKKQYERAIASDPESSLLPEAKFQLGHCLLRLKDLEGAKQQWEQLVTMKNDFWSPLAKNELKMLETP